MKIFYNILATTLTVIIIMLLVVRFMPLNFFGFDTDNLGVSYTQLVGTENLSTFPTLWNATMLAFNTGKMETSTTSVAGITTLANLTTVGTIGTGVWEGTGITVAYNGTGTTTPEENQVIIGNDTAGFKVIGFGANGQFLTSGGADTVPSWTTSALDKSDDYTWTGLHYYAATSTFSGLTASSTVNFPLVLNTIDYAFPSYEGASSTVLSTDGSGNLIWSNKAFTTGHQIATDTLALDQTVGNTTNLSVNCTAGKYIMSGGFSGIPAIVASNNPDYVVTESYPSDHDTWAVEVLCNGGSCTAGTLTVYAICTD